jgi:hypothetical protein
MHMGNHEALARRFAEANLRAEVIARSSADRTNLASGAELADVFRMTIVGEGRGEHFRIWPGADTNRVVAEGIDRALRQLVLLVQEPVRTFAERIPRRGAEIDRTQVKVLAEDRWSVWVERRTVARKRHFLCGRDERQLFICRVPRAVTAVRDAHRALRAPGLRGAAEAVRQGEWFFLEPAARELDALDAALRALRTIVRTRAAIGPGGHPHVADELVVVPPTQVEGVQVERLVLVRGRVRHVDHDTVTLRSWAKVVRNAEPVQEDGIARMDGIRWID